MAARILIVSPIATHPQNQGNSARIHSVGCMLQAAGLTVHFLYYQLEGLTECQRLAMETCWEHFHPVPVIPKDMRPTNGDTYGLDDWWQPRVAEIARDLHKRWRFQAVITNYVWFSGVLEAFGPDVVKIIDTHDMFGGRAERFRQAGMVPEWYYTTEAEEARGLRRANIVLAIQDEEAASFRALNHPDVRVLGHILEVRKRSRRRVDQSRIVAGYLASGNPINVISFERMRSQIALKVPPNIDLVVAGSICDQLSVPASPFRVLGRVECLDDFYDGVDVVVNPMAFGTGLKIKSVEAVFEGMPLVATTSAMNGLPVVHPLHNIPTPEEVARILGAAVRTELPALAKASSKCAAEYGATVKASCLQLVQACS